MENMTDTKKPGVENPLVRLHRKVEAYPGRRPEVCFILLYVVLLGVVAAFHEPWFDEAEAWQIAKCASLRDILLTIPHYEGHPPLWHLLLLPPAKLGAPYELSLKAVNIAVCAFASGLLIFRSPFPRALRLSLPFTFFLFYQYGVISRPYSVMFLAFMLAAIAYPRRDEKPFRFVMALMLLCLSHAYGIVFAGGIAIVWLTEIYGKQRPSVFIRSLFRDRRIFALLLLLLQAIVNIWLILPRSNTYSAVSDIIRDNSFIRLLYTLIILPADAWFYECFNTISRLQSAYFDPFGFSFGIVLGLLFWFVLILYSRRRGTTALLIIPYSLFAVFAAVVYLYRHHIGTAALFLLFWAWVSAGKKPGERAAPSGAARRFSHIKPSVRNVLSRLYPGVCAFVMLVSITWSAVSSVQEIGTAYSYGRDAAKFLKAYGLEDLHIMTGWREKMDSETGKTVPDTNYTSAAIPLLPYFSSNIVGNLNNGTDSLAYVTHRIADEETNRNNLRSWASRGIPDVLIGYVDLQTVYGDLVSLADYAPVYELKQTMLWKTDIPDDVTFYFMRQYIYLRRELLSEYGLTELKTDSGVYAQN